MQVSSASEKVTMTIELSPDERLTLIDEFNAISEKFGFQMAVHVPLTWKILRANETGSF